MTFLPRIATAIVSVCLIIAAATASHSAEVNLSWEPPTTNTDGSPTSDIKGYRVHVGTAPGSYPRSEETGNGITATVGGLDEGQTYYFAVTAFDSEGTESDFSNEVSQTIPTATPAPAPEPATPATPAEPTPATPAEPAPTTPNPAPATPAEPSPATPTPAPSAPPVVGGIAKGDVDGNGVIAMPDVLATLQIVIGDGVFSTEMKDRADVWPLASGLPLGDGKVALDDCLAILRKVVKPGAW